MKDLVECGKITKKRWKRDIGTQKNADGAYDHKGATLRQREVMETADYCKILTPSRMMMPL